jgi:hypothetical protein
MSKITGNKRRNQLNKKIKMNLLVKITIFLKYKINKIKLGQRFFYLLTITKKKWWWIENKFRNWHTEQKELIFLWLKTNYKFLMMIMMNIYLL